ncbi:DUF4260 family protein [Labedella populi]|uniref:DUF4260 family protein n=1 Tax=Labedella populi TaxID=2498850 RepID=A0A3S5CGL6_9MICO|nr:DUF4260 domain-containing protein [Labedella populi]RWZ55096.1 DUF4260 family protein [Labedella populi]
MTTTPVPRTTAPNADHSVERARLTNPELLQRLEGGLIIVLSMVAIVVIAPTWWWVPLAAFLLFDLSQLGYLLSTRAGAAAYNAVHTYVWPAALAVVAFLTWSEAPTVGLWTMLSASAWAFHVAVDRALGYGLKRPDAFTHTHLGWIGKDRAPEGGTR